MYLKRREGVKVERLFPRKRFRVLDTRPDPAHDCVRTMPSPLARTTTWIVRVMSKPLDASISSSRRFESSPRVNC
jgi:hypothetical protein